MASSTFGLVVKYAAVDVVGSFLYFPVWWYTAGVVKTAVGCAGTVRGYARQFGVGVWLKNLFVPMFGQHDLAGRVISFFIRLGVVIYYSLVLLALSVIMTAWLAAWLALPVVIGVMLFGQAGAFLKSFGP
jgi:hypothetical protein